MQYNAGWEAYSHAVKSYGSRRVFRVKLLGNYGRKILCKRQYTFRATEPAQNRFAHK